MKPCCPPATLRSPLIVVACLSVLGSLLSLAMPPDSDGMAVDSFGTRASGQKAIYDMLRELQVPMERSLGPPLANWQTPTTFVLWAPQSSLVSLEPTHLHRLAQWVKSGGRVVLAPASNQLWGLRGTTPIANPKDLSPISIWDALGLPKIEMQNVDVEASQLSDDAPAVAEPTPEPEPSFSSFFAEKEPVKSSPVTIKSNGDLAGIAEGLTELAAPEGKLESLKFEDEIRPRPRARFGSR